jgi:WhiB family redox-sensing transcriptional regulator
MRVEEARRMHELMVVSMAEASICRPSMPMDDAPPGHGSESLETDQGTSYDASGFDVARFGATPLPPELSWQERALCAQTDPEAFFPEKGGSTREAKRVCLSCEVRVECLEYALANDERFGIWGGLSERERRRVKKRAV